MTGEAGRSGSGAGLNILFWLGSNPEKSSQVDTGGGKTRSRVKVQRSGHVRSQ